MIVKTLLDGLHYDGQLALRRKTKNWYDYLAAGDQTKMKYKYGYYEVERACIIDGVLVIYVE
jgi:hypothetical protein